MVKAGIPFKTRVSGFYVETAEALFPKEFPLITTLKVNSPEY